MPRICDLCHTLPTAKCIKYGNIHTQICQYIKYLCVCYTRTLALKRMPALWSLDGGMQKVRNSKRQQWLAKIQLVHKLFALTNGKMTWNKALNWFIRKTISIELFIQFFFIDIFSFLLPLLFISFHFIVVFCLFMIAIAPIFVYRYSSFVFRLPHLRISQPS